MSADQQAPATYDRDTALAFLTTVFAHRPGLVQVCSTGRWVGRFFTTMPEGLAAAADYGRSCDGLRAAGVYFRATTLVGVPENDEKGKPRRGGADDTLTVPMMWGDVDYGQEGHKKGEALPPTAEDAMTVIHEAGLGEPTTLIHSGGGLYPLWMLDRAVSQEDAARLAVWTQEALLVASQRHGWTYGTGVSDLARVLRLPGSVNRKTANARPCRIIGGSGKTISPDAIPEPVAKAPTENPAVGAARPLPARRDPADLDPTRRSGPLDALAAAATWAQILGPAGWTFVATESDGAERWLRPGDSTSEYSARAFEHNLVCHSESAGLPSGAGQRLTKGRVYAYLWHGGDASAAVVGLLRGDNPGGLPSSVLDSIRAASDPWAEFGLGTRKLGQAAPAPGTGGATAEEMHYFLATYTRFTRPDKLGRRAAWMANDEPNRLGWHARCMVQDVLDGHYPADRALAALASAYRAHGGQEATGPGAILSAALGAVLALKVGAC